MVQTIRKKILILAFASTMGFLVSCTQVDEQSEASIETQFDSRQEEVLFGLREISLSINEPIINAGEKINLMVEGIYKDGSSKSITSYVDWAISDNSLATIINIKEYQITLLTLQKGELELTASIGMFTQSIKVTISQATVSGVYFLPKSATIPKNSVIGLSVFAILSNNEIVEIGADENLKITVPDGVVFLGVNDEGIAEFQGNKKGRFELLGTYDNVVGEVFLEVKTDEVTTFEVSPKTASIALGSNTKFTAMGTSPDKYSFNLSSKTTWSVEDPSMGDISSEGLFTAKKLGKTKIKAVYEGKERIIEIQIRTSDIVEIKLAADVADLPIGLQTNWEATAVYKDGLTKNITSSCEFSSSDPSVGEFISTNILFGHKTGFIDVMAECFGVKSTVSYAISDKTIIGINFSRSNRVEKLEEIKMIAGVRTFLKVFAELSDGSFFDLTNEVQLMTGNQFQSYEKVTLGSSIAIELYSMEPTNASLKVFYESFSGKLWIMTSAPVITALDLVTQEDDFEPFEIPLGKNKTFKVMATYSNNEEPQELDSASVFWHYQFDHDNFTMPPIYINNSQDPGIVETFLETHDKEIQPVVFAEVGSLSVSKSITVNPPIIDSIQLSAAVSNVDISASLELEKGQTVIVSGVATFSDQTTKTLEELCDTHQLSHVVTSEVTIHKLNEDPIFDVDISNLCIDGTASIVALQEGVAIFEIKALPNVSQFREVPGDDPEQLVKPDGSVKSTLEFITRTPCTPSDTVIPFGRHGIYENVYCWYQGNLNESCTTTCGNVSRVTHTDAILKMVGKQGSLYTCENLVKSFPAFENIESSDLASEVVGAVSELGCSVNDVFGAKSIRRYIGSDTTVDALDPFHSRVCACTD